MKRIEVLFPMVLPSVANLREHWAAKARRVKAQRATTSLMLHAGADRKVLAQLLINTPVIEVTLTRCAARRLDDDNLASAFKACRDSVAAFLAIDDGSKRLRWKYAQAPKVLGKSQVRITIVEAA